MYLLIHIHVCMLGLKSIHVSKRGCWLPQSQWSNARQNGHTKSLGLFALILCAVCLDKAKSCKTSYLLDKGKIWWHNIKRWRHNGRDSVSNHQPHHCLLNRLFRPSSKKTSNLCVTGLCVGNSPGTSEFPAQTASNAENVSIWWRHHESGHRHTRMRVVIRCTKYAQNHHQQTNLNRFSLKIPVICSTNTDT